MLQVIKTGDGSHSLFNEELNETYHSRHGAIQESRHVFIQHGLHHIMRHKPQEIKILEIGFGPGLNALLTLIESFKADVNIKYHAIDNFPLDDAIVWALNYEKMVSADRPNLFFQLHKASWDVEVELSAQFALEKKKIDIITIDDLGRGIYDLVYFDAFAPAKQPEMWSLQVLTTVIRAIRQGGVLVTYCAKGQLKRDLSNLNMEVETLQGPSGKKEMVRATVLF